MSRSDRRPGLQTGPNSEQLKKKEKLQMKRLVEALSKSKIVIRIAFLATLALATGAQSLMAQANEVDFDLTPNPKTVACLGVPNGPTPTAHVVVKRGPLADTLTIVADNIRPHLAFDMFTVQRSNLRSNGTVDPTVKNFGLAWYQSDLQANGAGHLSGTLHTILLDQIFGFDADQSNPAPINTFHLGFWFNNPADAAACGFDVTKPTPFNGEHNAGPVAMISLPNATTKLGPLCTNPNTHTHPPSCNP
jgi:hypothetical protein